MKFKIIISALVLGLIYTQAKTAYWAENVASPYMEALWATDDCRRKVLYNNRLPIIERVLGLRPPLKPGATLDMEMSLACDKMTQRWHSYEMKRKSYKSYFPL